MLDNSVLSDLHSVDLLRLLGGFSFRKIIPDVVYDEYTRIEGAVMDIGTLESWGLMVESMEPDAVEEVIRLIPQHPALSTPDLFALVMAQEREALLLAGDKNLRTVAEYKGVQTHGILWVLDELIRLALLDPPTAHARLTVLMIWNKRLPSSECEKRLARWERRRDAGKEAK